MQSTTVHKIQDAMCLRAVQYCATKLKADSVASTHGKAASVNVAMMPPNTTLPTAPATSPINKSGNRSGHHYQIEPKSRMTVQAYKGALDNFARAAVARSVELART